MPNKKQSQIAALILSFVAAYSGMGCLMTGMGFFNMPMFYVAAACALAAAVTAFTADRKWFPAIPAAFILLCIRLWRKGNLELSLEAFLSKISSLYNSGYGWGIIRWTDEVLHRDMSLLILCLLGAWLAFGICYGFLKGKGIFFPLLLTCLPVIPCMLLVDTVPESKFVFGTLTCIAVLLLIRLAKKQGHFVALLRLLVIPTALAVLLLFVCLPQKSYTSLQPMEDLFAYIQGFFAEGEEPEMPQVPVREEGSWVNLNAVGPKKQRRGIVMEVTANQTGYLYLRGAAYGTYHGTWWDYAQTEAPTYLAPTGTQRSVEITTKAIHNTLYLPYGTYGIQNSDFSLLEEQGRVENSDHWRSYTVKYRDLPGHRVSWEVPSLEASQANYQLPAATRQNAQAYLNRHLPDLQEMGVWEKANAIVEHVSTTALYSLNTPKMPAGTKDFALWFLEESDTGYCVHFASAAAVLLRAADIPCRYVTGYLVYAKANLTREVEQHNSHAWVEIYIDDVGWVPLEPTPGGGIAQTVDMETTAPSETETEAPTQTQDTTGSTVQTDPTKESAAETTVPPTKETTVPSKPTSPVGGADGPSQPDTPNAPSEPYAPWLLWLIYSLLAIGAIIGQWRVRVALRRRKCQKGKRSAQALHRWQEVVLHCRVRKVPLDERLHQLAQKAKFSHHAITREELGQFDVWLNASETVIRQDSLYKQLLSTIIYALF